MVWFHSKLIKWLNAELGTTWREKKNIQQVLKLLILYTCKHIQLNIQQFKIGGSCTLPKKLIKYSSSVKMVDLVHLQKIIKSWLASLLESVNLKIFRVILKKSFLLKLL